MTAVFRSCLPRFYSNTNQSISIEHLSMKTNSIDNEQFDENSMDSSSVITNQNIIKSKITTDTPLPCSKIPNTKKRGPSYSRINEKSTSLLTRLVETVFGDQGSSNTNHQSKVLSKKKQRSKRSTRKLKKSILPSKSTIKKQFEDNEQTLRSLVTLLTQIDENSSKNFSVEKEQARNNNRMDDTSSSHSHDSYHHKSKSKPNHQPSRRYTNNRSTKKNKKRLSEENTLSSSSILSHYSFQSTSNIRRKMVDNQQQTQIYPPKINIGTSTQYNDAITSEPSWLDVMREDQTTIDAWARIRRRLKPNQQKDILRALMIICANLFEVPIENKQF